MVDIPVLLSSISTAINITKTVREIKSDFDQADLRAQMVQVMETLSDTKVALIEAGDELRAKDAEIARLKTAFERQGEFVQARQYLYFKDSDGNPSGRPICERCYRVDGRVMLTSVAGAMNTVQCPQCKTKYDHVRIFAAPKD